MAGPGSESRRQVGVGDEPARCLQGPDVDEAVAVRAHDRDDVSAAGRRTRNTYEGDEHGVRADAGLARLPSLLSADRLDARGMDDHRAGAHEMAAQLPEGSNRRDGTD